MAGAILAQKPGTLHRTMVRSRASLKGLARGSRVDRRHAFDPARALRSLRTALRGSRSRGCARASHADARAGA